MFHNGSCHASWVEGYCLGLRVLGFEATQSFRDLWNGQHTGLRMQRSMYAAAGLQADSKQHGLHAAQLVALCATLLKRLPCCCVCVLCWRLQDNRKDNRRHREYQTWHSHLTLDLTLEAPFHVPALQYSQLLLWHNCSHCHGLHRTQNCWTAHSVERFQTPCMPSTALRLTCMRLVLTCRYPVLTAVAGWA